jgi:hypothetical protein
MNRLFVSLIIACLVAGSAVADDWDQRWGLGLELGLWKQMGGDHDYSNIDQFGSIKLRFGLSPAMSLDLGFKYGYTRPGAEMPFDDAGFTFDKYARLYTRTWQPNLTGTYRFVSEGAFRPWGSLGAGVTRWDIRDLRDEKSVGLWPDGVGMRVWESATTSSSARTMTRWA